MSVKLLHTADVHLDAPFHWLGSKGGAQRRQLRETFRAVVDLALREKVDVLLVAGDLFDSNAPSQDAVDLVQSQLERLGVPVFLLPGTHDCFDRASVYRRLALPPHVRLFDSSREAFALDTLGLTVHAKANLTRTSTQSPLAGLERNPATRFNVALAHGSLRMPGTEGDFPVAPDEIATTGMDYVAMGHWHGYRECAGTRACYSGPPELLDADGDGHGQVLLVELGDGPPVVLPRQVGRLRCKKVELPLDGVRSGEEIRERVRGLGGPDIILSLTLSGVRSLDLLVDPDDLAADLDGDFYAVRIHDRSHAAVSSEELEGLSEKLILGQYVRRVSALIAQSTDEKDRRVRERALQLGVALLRGKKVLR